VLELAPLLLGSGSTGINHIVPDLRLVRVECRTDVVEHGCILDKLADLCRLGEIDLNDICLGVLLRETLLR